MYAPEAEKSVRLFLKYGLVSDPWQAAARGHPTLDPDLESTLRAVVNEIASEPLDRLVLDSWPITQAQIETGIREVLLSSGSFDAYLATGSLTLTAASLHEAIRRVRLLVREGGLARLMLGYGYTALVENLMAVRHYGSMREEDFVSGRLHRPWVSRSLEYELAAGMAVGHYELVPGVDGRFVKLTRRGAALWRDAQELWRVTGYADTRHRLSMMAEFANLADLDELTNLILPDFMDMRRAFINDCDIPAGAKLLEVGSGSGMLTFDAGLYDTLRPSSLTCVDPSPVLTGLAMKKAKRRHAQGVRFVRGVAESLPFPPESFDHALAFAVMQYTDREQALPELYRVLRPGGSVAISVPLDLPALHQTVMQRWFKPLQRPSYGSFVFVSPDDIPEHALAAGFRVLSVSTKTTSLDYSRPELTVRIMMQFHVFQDTLSALPYQARLDLRDDLIGRGRYLLSRGADMRFEAPMQWVWLQKP
jgi:SAM-dependent methyltransferase